MEKVDQIQKDIKELQEKVAENQLSVVVAIKNLFEEILKEAQGKESNIKPAFYGLLNAYFRPRIILTFGAIMATIFSAAQLVFLYNQNQMLKNQNKLIKLQDSYAKFDQISHIRSFILNDSRNSNMKRSGEETKWNRGISSTVLRAMYSLLKDDTVLLKTVIPLLALDNNGKVSFGAFQFMSEYPHYFTEIDMRDYYELKNISVERGLGNQLNIPINFRSLEIENSHVNSNITIGKCKFSSPSLLKIKNSSIFKLNVERDSIWIRFDEGAPVGRCNLDNVRDFKLTFNGQVGSVWIKSSHGRMSNLTDISRNVALINKDTLHLKLLPRHRMYVDTLGKHTIQKIDK